MDGYRTVPQEQIKGFPPFFEAEYKPLMRYLIFLGATREEALNVAQEAMTQVLRRWARVETPRSYVRTTARRIFFTGCEKARREQEGWRELARLQNRCASEPLDAETRWVLEMLQALPERQRNVVALTMEGYTPEQISEMTESKAATVRSNLRHATSRLKMLLDSAEFTRKEVRDGPERLRARRTP